MYYLTITALIPMLCTMNKIIIYWIILLLTFSCQKEILPIFPTNQIKKNSNVETQIFNLGTIKSKIIEGKKGTKIYFNRNDFNINNNKDITLIFKELYEFEDLFYNNINTKTTDNELLESSGVLFIEFNQEGKEIQLKKNTYLKIFIPNNRLVNNKLFQANIDTLGQFKWNELKRKKAITQKTTVESKDGFRIVTDTIAYDLGDFQLLDSLSSKLLLKKLNWINIDVFIDNITKKTFKIKINNPKIKLLNAYFIYQNRNAFLSYSRTINELEFKDIPIIKDSTSLILIGIKDSTLYAEKVKLKQNDFYNITLKKINEAKLSKLLK